MSESPEIAIIPFKGPDGKEIRGYPVKVTSPIPDWVSFTLEDGTVLQFKTMPLAIYRIDGEWDDDGSPKYVSQMANFVQKNSAGYTGQRKVKEKENADN